jgi:predicted carbohydrate-binding protein with CBM5 and CBM33 domain
MTQALRRARTRTQLAAMACTALVVTALAVLMTSAPAQAHGNVNDPVARGYR